MESLSKPLNGEAHLYLLPEWLRPSGKDRMDLEEMSNQESVIGSQEFAREDDRTRSPTEPSLRNGDHWQDAYVTLAASIPQPPAPPALFSGSSQDPAGQEF